MTVSGAPNRRDFIKAASLSAASTALVQPAVPRIPRGANDTIGIGVIGVGGMGGAHCSALMDLAKSGKDNHRIVAVSDVCKPNLDRWVKKCSDVQSSEVAGHRDYQDLLAQKDVDVVWIATPEHWHSKMAIDALAAKKDVYVEKPMCLDLKDALALWDAAKKAQQVVEVGTQYVMVPKYIKARELIQQGRIGKPVSSQTGYCRNSKDGEWNYYKVDESVKPGEMLDWEGWCGPLGVQPFDTLVFHRWRRYRKYSTGIIGDLLVHQITPLIWALDVGWPTRVVASGGHYIDKAMENHDQVNLTIEFEKGHTMVVWGSTCNASGPAPLIHGHRGNINLSGNNCQLVPENLYAEEIDGETFKLPGATHDDLRLDFLKASRNRSAPASPVELGVKIMVVVDLAARSLWEGKAFAFDPKTLTCRAC